MLRRHFGRGSIDMGVETRIYRLDDELAINVPSSVLPPAQIYREEKYTPSYYAETRNTYPVIVRPYTGRTAVLLTPMGGIAPYVAMQELGLDTAKPIEIRLHGYREWIPAHIYHGYYGRVWVPADIAKRTKIREYTSYPAFIRGWTPAIVPEEVVRREVLIRHFGTRYQAQEYGNDRYRWVIPHHLESYPVIKVAADRGISPKCRCHYDIQYQDIQTDFMIEKHDAKDLGYATGIFYRNMAVRNYTATIETRGYPFLAELRATLITNVPQEYYQTREHYLKLIDALGITVQNMVFFFMKSVRHAEKKDKVSWTQQKIDKVMVTATPDFEYDIIDETYGLEINEKIDYGEAMDFKIGHVEKYIRIINEQSYKRNDFNPHRQDEWFVYQDDEIEAVLAANPFVDIDEYGMVWINQEAIDE